MKTAHLSLIVGAAVAVAVYLSIDGGPPISRYKVSIGGTPGTPFAGWCEVEGAHGARPTDKFSGIVGRDTLSYDFEARGITCEFVKQSETGVLFALLRESRRTIGQGETTDPFGRFAVSTRFPNVFPDK